MLDDTGFPWERVSYRSDRQLMLRPLRADPPALYGELHDYNERLPIVLRNRMVDYMSQIEACDFQIEAIRYNPEDGMQLIDGLPYGPAPMLPKGEVVFEAAGFTWGRLPISPLVAPATWPFAAGRTCKDGRILIEPTGAGRVDVVLRLYKDVPELDQPSEDPVISLLQSIEKHMGISERMLRVNVEWHQGLAFARAVAEEGWAKAYATHFPHGPRLGPGDFDETRVSG